MPIKPENRVRYPKDWKQIRARILERSDHRCECAGECGDPHDGRERCNIPNGKLIRRLVDDLGAWVPASCESKGGALTKPFRCVLTIAHLDHTPENCADDNLRAFCQRCHLRYDSAHHAANARRTRFKARACGELF